MVGSGDDDILTLGIVLVGCDNGVEDKYCPVDSVGYADGSAVGTTVGSAVSPSSSSFCMVGDTELSSANLSLCSLNSIIAAMEPSSDNMDNDISESSLDSDISESSLDRVNVEFNVIESIRVVFESRLDGVGSIGISAESCIDLPSIECWDGSLIGCCFDAEGS